MRPLLVKVALFWGMTFVSAALLAFVSVLGFGPRFFGGAPTQVTIEAPSTPAPAPAPKG